MAHALERDQQILAGDAQLLCQVDDLYPSRHCPLPPLPGCQDRRRALQGRLARELERVREPASLERLGETVDRGARIRAPPRCPALTIHFHPPVPITHQPEQRRLGPCFAAADAGPLGLAPHSAGARAAFSGGAPLSLADAWPSSSPRSSTKASDSAPPISSEATATGCSASQVSAASMMAAAFFSPTPGTCSSASMPPRKIRAGEKSPASTSFSCSWAPTPGNSASAAFPWASSSSSRRRSSSTSLSLLMSTRKPVSLAASRAFCPFLPMDSESWLY